MLCVHAARGGVGGRGGGGGRGRGLALVGWGRCELGREGFVRFEYGRELLVVLCLWNESRTRSKGTKFIWSEHVRSRVNEEGRECHLP